MSDRPDLASAMAMAAQCATVVEVADERTEFSRSFVTPTGARRLETSAVPQRVRRADGSWAAVDLSLVASAGALVPSAALGGVRISSGGTGPLVTAGSAGAELSLSWPQALPSPRVEGETAVFESVLPDVDLRVSATATGFRQVLVVKTARAAADPALAQVRYRLGGDVVPKASTGGGLVFVDAAGAQVATVGAASMWDSSVDPAAAGEVLDATVSRVASGEQPADLVSTARRAGAAAASRRVGVAVQGSDLVVTPDLAMLTAPATVYPVFIDPLVDLARTKWAYANSINSDWDVNGEAWVGRNPYDNTLYRSFFDFDVSSLKGTNIISASVKMVLDHSWSCSPTPAYLYRTSSITVSNGARMSWGTRPLPSSVYLDSASANANEAGGCGSIQNDANVEFASSALTNDVQYGADNDWDGYTVGLCACDSSGENESAQDRWKRFFTSPTYLVVDYNSHPNTATAMATVLPSGCVSTSSGTDTASLPRLNATNAGAGVKLRTVVSDADGGTVRAQFEWWPKATKGSSGRIGVVTTASPGLASGSTLETVVASGTLTEGQAYSWRVRGYDGTDYSSSWSAWCEFVVDNTAPSEPTVSSTDLPAYPLSAPATAVVGRPATVTFTPAGGVDAEVAGYVYGISDTTPTPSIFVPAAANGNATVTVTPPGDSGATIKALTVLTVDKAGNRSALPELGYSYRFRINAAAGWWPAKESTGPLGDVSGGGRNMSLNNGATAGYGTASFPGSGWSQTLSPVLSTTTSFTVAAWVRVNNGTDWRAIVSQAGTYVSGFYLQYQPGTGKWRFALPTTDQWNPSFAEVYSSAAAQLGVWTHVAGVYDSSAGQVRLYVNGVLQGTASYAGPHWSATGVFQVGRTYYNSSSVNYMAGDVAEVGAWQRVLDAAGIAALAKLPPAAGQWGMDDPGALAAADGSRLAALHNANLSGGAGWHSGHTGRGLHLDGSAQAATTSSVTRTDRSYTVSAWVRLSSGGSSSHYVLTQDGSSRSGYQLIWDAPSGKWAFTIPSVDTGTPTWQTVYSTSTASLNTWVHLAAVYNDITDQITFYVNGTLQGARSSVVTWNATGATRVGSGRNGSNFFPGDVDDVRIFAGALSAGQITTLATS